MQTLRELDELRQNLTQKLEELRRRANAAADLAATPVRYWQNPAVRFGLGVVLGFAIGGGRRDGEASSSESLVRAIVRAGLMAVTSSLVSRTLAPEALTAGDEPTARDEAHAPHAVTALAGILSSLVRRQGPR